MDGLVKRRIGKLIVTYRTKMLNGRYEVVNMTIEADEDSFIKKREIMNAMRGNPHFDFDSDSEFFLDKFEIEEMGGEIKLTRKFL